MAEAAKTTPFIKTTLHIITLVKDGKAFIHDYNPPTMEEALRVGNELVRDMVADFFRVDLKKQKESLVPLLGLYNLQSYSCGYCKFEGLVSPNESWTRCPSCGAL